MFSWLPVSDRLWKKCCPCATLVIALHYFPLICDKLKQMGVLGGGFDYRLSYFYTSHPWGEQLLHAEGKRKSGRRQDFSTPSLVSHSGRSLIKVAPFWSSPSGARIFFPSFHLIQKTFHVQLLLRMTAYFSEYLFFRFSIVLNTFWKRIYCAQILRYDKCRSISLLKTENIEIRPSERQTVVSKTLKTNNI